MFSSFKCEEALSEHEDILGSKNEKTKNRNLFFAHFGSRLKKYPN